MSGAPVDFIASIHRINAPMANPTSLTKDAASLAAAQADMQATIDMLARDLACDSEYVAAVYRSEHSRLCDSARLQDFVPLFAARFTRDRILQDKERHR